MPGFLWQLAKLSRLRFFYLATRGKTQRLTALYVLIASFVSLSTLGAVAYFLKWSLLFPVLGPTAFLIFYSPARSMSWPRNCILGHLSALICGLAAYLILARFFPQALSHRGLPLLQALFASGAMALAALVMVSFRILHPPAASTAMLAATGYFDSLERMAGLILALFLLSAEGVLLHRLAGIVYPWWREKGGGEEPPIRTKLGDLGESTSTDPMARLAHQLTTRRK
ncbi:HPP family protein [Thermosulfurimonas sp.]|uniref:HPP family protein n=1 Tax=Thermosulfurimonas sp. TaxID=2080236 RepID=UPI0025E48886|nr:HPP family protein [Thermosulfurimonas sp.]